MRKVKWGVMGTAGIAASCSIPGMVLAEHCELTAIAGRDLQKAEAYRDRFGFARAYGSYEELLTDPEIEAVYIPLPNDLHAPWAIRAMEAGKHVLCEKPMAPTAALAEEMIRTAEKNGVFLMEAFAYLHSPLIRAIREEIRSGAIGELCNLEAAFSFKHPRPGNIRLFREHFGGAMYDVGCYCTSLALWMYEREPETVKAVSQFTPEGIDIVTTGLLTFGEGKEAVIHCGMNLASGRLDRMTFIGTQGSISTPAPFNGDGELPYTVTTDAGSRTVTVSTPHNYSLETEQLSRCILEGETPHVSHAFTLANARTVDRLLASMGY